MRKKKTERQAERKKGRRESDKNGEINVKSEKRNIGMQTDTQMDRKSDETDQKDKCKE